LTLDTVDQTLKPRQFLTTGTQHLMHTILLDGRLRLFSALVASIALCLVSAAHAAPVAPGQAFTPIVTTDQHDRALRTEATTRTVLLAADKKASDMLTGLLQGRGADVLSSRQAVFIADIHAMPALVTRMFAVPAMRELPFAIGLGRDAALTAALPRHQGQVTLITLRDGVVQSVHFITSAAELQQQLELPLR
jgi:hypothetical protein